MTQICVAGLDDHRMMTSSNGNIFRVTGHLCGDFTGPRWIPRTKASDAGLWFDLCLNQRLSKQSWGWWFETLSLPLWRYCNGLNMVWRLFGAKPVFRAMLICHCRGYTDLYMLNNNFPQTRSSFLLTGILPKFRCFQSTNHSWMYIVWYYEGPRLFCSLETMAEMVTYMIYLGLNKLASSCRRHFPNHFFKWNIYSFDSNLTEGCSNKGPIKNNSSLVEVMAWHRPITWTNDDALRWCICASLHRGRVTHKCAN